MSAKSSTETAAKLYLTFNNSDGESGTAGLTAYVFMKLGPHVHLQPQLLLNT